MFLVFDKSDAIRLRKHRIVGQLIGCSPKSPNQIVVSGLPCHVSHYGARIALENKFARLARMISPQREISLEENETKFGNLLIRLKEEANREFLEKRASELKKRKLEAPLGKFDESKLKWTVANQPNSILETTILDELEANSLTEACFHSEKDKHNLIVFRNLYNYAGIYTSSGMKFGCDFLVYLGDPVMYHAQYAVKVAASSDGGVDLKKISYSEINALNRLCHTANKIIVFAIVYQERVVYWTLKTRQFLTPDSDNSAFESIDPSTWTASNPV